MLVYITNRVLTKTPITKPLTLTRKQIGTKLRKPVSGQTSNVSGLSKGYYKSIKFYPKGDEKQLFDEIPDEECDKPWLVFLHGFHQDVSESIEKVQKLHQLHGVNVILFSWPSRPLTKNISNKKDIKKFLKHYLLSSVGYAARPSLIKTVKKTIIDTIKDYYLNYEPARKNAEASVNDFHSALTLISEHLQPRIKSNRLSMVVHSMGNYLLKNTIQSKGGLPIVFQHIMCHQADVKASDHASWIPALYGYVNKNIYITVNKYDSTLGASSVYRLTRGIVDTERMGSSTSIKPESGHQGYINNFVKYLDLSDGRGVENKHEIFTSTSARLNLKKHYNSEHVAEPIMELFSRIFSSQNDGLPGRKGSSKSGFSYMKTKPHIFKPEYIVEDEDLCQWSTEWNCLIKSLDEFTDPYETFHDDPDFEDF